MKLYHLEFYRWGRWHRCEPPTDDEVRAARSQLLNAGDSEARDSGITGWRTVTEETPAVGSVTAFIAPHQDVETATDETAYVTERRPSK